MVICRRPQPLPLWQDDEAHSDRLEKLENALLIAGAVELAILEYMLPWASHVNSRQSPAPKVGAKPRVALA